MPTRYQGSMSRVATYTIAILVLLVGIYLVNQPVVWISFVPFALLLFLLWRAVRALERIAAAVEKND